MYKDSGERTGALLKTVQSHRSRCVVLMQASLVMPLSKNEDTLRVTATIKANWKSFLGKNLLDSTNRRD